MENIENADVQTQTQDVETTTESTESKADVVSRTEYEKALAEAEKYKGRYKSQMKKSATSGEVTHGELGDSVDKLDALIDVKLKSIKEEDEFIRKYGETSLNDEVKSIKDKHPSLTLEEAYKLSSIGNDIATNADTSANVMVGDPLDTSGKNKTTYTMEELSNLTTPEYNKVMENKDKGLITITP